MFWLEVSIGPDGQRHGTARPVKLKSRAGPGIEALGKGTALAQPTTAIIKKKKKKV